jgi:hypothetical protein
MVKGYKDARMQGYKDTRGYRGWGGEAMSGKRGTRWSPVGTGSFPFAVSVASGDPSGTGKRHIATLQKVRLTAAGVRGRWE